jgi:hypothetical protein
MKRKWVNGYERMAYVTLEHLCGRTVVDIATSMGWDPQRVTNVINSGLAVTRQTRIRDPYVVALNMRYFTHGLTDAERDVDSIEAFTRRELTFRGTYRFNGTPTQGMES